MDELKAMRVLVQVADQGSMAAAARALDLAPAVVTRLVAELEAALGARLLQRSTRRLSFTDAGQRYLLRARHIVAEVEEARAVVDDATSRPRGPLRLLAPPALAVHQLTAHLASFIAQYPEVALELHTPGPVAVPDEGFDISLLVLSQPPDGDFVARRLACSEMVVCASPEYLRRRGAPQHPLELLQHDAMLPSGVDVVRDIRFQSRQGHETLAAEAARSPVLRGTHYDVMLSAALNGLGIVGLPSFVADRALRAGQLVALLPDWYLLTLSIWAAVPTRLYLPARTRAMLAHLVECFGGDAAGRDLGRAYDPWLGREVPQAVPSATRLRDARSAG